MTEINAKRFRIEMREVLDNTQFHDKAYAIIRNGKVAAYLLPPNSKNNTNNNESSINNFCKTENNY